MTTRATWLSVIPAVLLMAGSLRADSIGSAYSSILSFNTLTAPAGLILLGGLTFDPNNPNSLLIGVNAGESSGAIDSVSLTRDPITHRITGYSGSPTFYALAPDIDGGLAIAPDYDLLFTQYPDNTLGELKPGSTTADKTAAVSIAASTGGLTFVPAGFSDSGSVVLTSYNHSVVCTALATPDSNGTYTIGGCNNSVTLAGTLEGVLYVPAGTDGFSLTTMLIASFSGSTGGAITAYQVDSNGLPIASTASTLFAGGTNEGLAVDPVTGDILATSYSFGSNPSIYDIYANVQTAPEPDTAGLVLLGIASVAMLIRGRRRHAV